MTCAAAEPKPPMPTTCLCQRNPHPSFQGDHPERFDELRVESHEPGHAPRWRVRCRVCGTAWTVVGIPGGGIYGDFDWQRIESP
jgi:hypothetical protein